MKGLRPALLLALLALAAGPAPAAPARQGGGEGSLEELLRSVRRRRTEATAKLLKPLEKLLAELDATPPNAKPELERIKGGLIALGTDVAPLLVPHLEPGEGAEPPAKRRAKLVSEALVALPTRSVTDALIAQARAGTTEGRVNALRALSVSPDREKAGACLVEVFHSAGGEVRLEAMRSLARLGGPENQGILVEALGETDAEVLRAVLGALADVSSVAGLERVRGLVGAPPLAARLVKEILLYYRAIAAHLAPEDFEGLVRLAAHGTPSKEDRQLILDSLPGLQPEVGPKLRKLFDPLLTGEDDDLRVSAQLCLARLGDRNERKELMKRFNELVERNDDWAGAYEQRGSILLKLGDPAEAAKDYARAVKVYQDHNQPPADETVVNLARAYARDSNLKKAFETLSQYGLPRSLMKSLAVDPDFRALAEHGRYGRVFDP